MTGYACKILAWIDGDTCDVEIPLDFPVLGFSIAARKRVRVIGMDAPNMRSADEAERAAGAASKKNAEVLCPPGSMATLKFGTDFTDKYGRSLASILCKEGGINFSAKMISDGYAQWWDGKGPKPKWRGAT